MAQKTTPSSTLFDTMKVFASISNKELAGMILSDRPTAGGRAPRSRIEDKTWLNRYVVHVAPGESDAATFADFEESSRQLASHMKRRDSKKPKTNTEIIEFFTGPAADNMDAALRDNGLDVFVYRNTMKRILSDKNLSPADIVDLLLFQYLIIGCLGNPGLATDRTLQYAKEKMNAAFHTSLPSMNEEAEQPQKNDVRLALYRVVDEALAGSAFPLNTGPEGTIIGHLATDQHSITNVDPTVSGKHLHIWRDDAGRWWAQGMGSRNGTLLTSGVDRTETIVELPRGKRGKADEAVAVEIHPSDRLRLGSNTVFMVVQVVS